LVSLELLGFLKHEISIISGISYKGCYTAAGVTRVESRVIVCVVRVDPVSLMPLL
jgi:hypothetical protein